MVRPGRVVSVFAWLLVSVSTAHAQQVYTATPITSRQGSAVAVNARGDVAGYQYSTDGYPHAFVSIDGTTTDIGTLGGNTSYAADINASGVVVGSAYLSGNATQHAFLFDGTLKDLGLSRSGIGYAAKHPQR